MGKVSFHRLARRELNDGAQYYELDRDERRIHAILGDDNERSIQNASRYQTHLLTHLALPLMVTGIEGFPWEEPYVIGGWDQREYEELKKTNPS